MSRTTPTQRSLALARERGLEAAVVEKWVTIPGMPGGGIRRDMGGFADLVLWSPGIGVLAVQACSGSTLAEHRTKLLAEPRLRSWLNSGGRCSIWAWRRLSAVKKDGKKGKAKRWSCLEEELFQKDFEK